MVCGRKALFSVLLCCVYSTVVERRNVMEYLLERVRDLDDDFCTTLGGVEELDKELGLLAEGKYLEVVEEQMVERALAEEPSPMEIATLLAHVRISSKAETRDAEQAGPKEIKNFEEFVSKAKEEPAKENILKYLPLAHGWGKTHDFHRFLESIYPKHCDEKVWESIYEFDWGDILWVACEAENVALAIKIREKKAQAQYDMITFDSELISACIEYDAINIFKKMVADPSLLEPHFKLMVKKSSGRLLQLYQAHIKSENLHLEELPFSEKPAASVESFIVLMDNGQNEFSLSQHITSLCEWGRLDILQYLYEWNQRFKPTSRGIELAAEKGHKDVLEWAFKLAVFSFDYLLKIKAITILAIHNHFQALDSLSIAKKSSSDYEYIWPRVISSIIEIGDFKILKRIIEKGDGIPNGDQVWINTAARKGHYQIFEYLYKKFKINPWLGELGENLDAILGVIQLENPSSITKEWVRDGAYNFEFLRWVLKNRPELLNDKEKEYLSRKEHKEWLTEWLLTNKASLDHEELVKYVEGNLKLLEAVAMDKLGSSLLNDAEWDVLRKEKLDAWLKKWRKEKNPDLINEDLVSILARSFELLHWTSTKMSGLLSNKEKEYLSEKEHSGLVMEWIHDNPNTRPSEEFMKDACHQNDLPAIKWAKNEWNILLTEQDTENLVHNWALRVGKRPELVTPELERRLQKTYELTEWLYEYHRNLVDIPKVFKAVVWYGELDLAKRLKEGGYSPSEGTSFKIPYIRAQHLELVKWLKSQNISLDLDAEMRSSAKYQPATFEWIVTHYPEEIKLSDAWYLAAKYGHHSIYKLLLENYPNGHRKRDMLKDFYTAVRHGHLEIIKLILNKSNGDSSLSEKLYHLEVPCESKSNYHALMYLRRSQKVKLLKVK